MMDRWMVDMEKVECRIYRWTSSSSSPLRILRFLVIGIMLLDVLGDDDGSYAV